MSWPLLISVLIEFFGPMLRAWLEDLLKKAEPAMGEYSETATAYGAVNALFREAKSHTSWWQFRKRAVLAACRSVAVSRADDLVEAARLSMPAPTMTDAEGAHIAAAME